VVVLVVLLLFFHMGFLELIKCNCSLPPGSTKESNDIDSSGGVGLRVRDAIHHGQQYVYTPFPPQFFQTHTLQYPYALQLLTSSYPPVDPEMKKEFEEQQKKSILSGGASTANPLQNFDMAAWMAGKTTGGAGVEKVHQEGSGGGGTGTGSGTGTGAGGGSVGGSKTRRRG